MKSLLVLSLALVSLLATGCTTTPNSDLASQVVLGNLSEVKAKIRDEVNGRPGGAPQVIADTNDRLHFRWGKGAAGTTQTDLVYYFATAERGTRVSLLEVETTESLNSEGKLVQRSHEDQVTSHGPNLFDMRSWWSERATR